MTVNQYIKLIGTHGRQMVISKDAFEIPAISELKGNVATRLHNRGQDDTGATRNYRSKAYVKRFKKIDPVSMVKDGDLRRDYESIKKIGGNNALGFRDSLNIKKILGEEKRRNGKLFSLRDEELSQFRRTLIRFINRLEKQILNV